MRSYGEVGQKLGDGMPCAREFEWLQCYERSIRKAGGSEQEVKTMKGKSNYNMHYKKGWESGENKKIERYHLCKQYNGYY